MTDLELMNMAYEAREMSYSPYSGFSVGAALLCGDGTVYKGCNIESATYTPTNCAERTAFFKAISEGKRDFTAIAITGGRHGEVSDFCTPCGVCRQVMAEFCSADFKIILGTKENIRTYSLNDVLPLAFTKDSLR